MKIPACWAPVLLLILPVLSCKKTPVAEGSPCDISIPVREITSSIPVLYKAYTSNNRSGFTFVTYRTATGDVVVKNPTLPWSVGINAKNGEQVLLSGTGSAFAGDTITLVCSRIFPTSSMADTVNCGY